MIKKHQDKTLAQEVMKAYDSIGDALGIMMHHDAITGTSRQFVADDYNLILSKAEKIVMDVYKTLIKQRF